MAVVGRRVGAARTRTIAIGRNGGAIVLLFLIGVVLSERPAIDFMGMHFTPMKIFLLVVFFPAAVALWKHQDLKLQVFDWFIVFTAGWLVVALFMNNGPGRALEYGGLKALEALGGYLIARAYVRTPAQFVRTVRWYIWLVAIVGALAIPEAVFGWKIFAFLDNGATYQVALPAEEDNYIRLGLHRAEVTFDHPILYGVFCSTAFGLAWYIYINSQMRWIALLVISISTFLSVSSAPLLACGLAAAFIVCEKLTRRFLYRTAIAISIVVAIIVLLDIAANRSPVAVILPFVSLNHWTAYYRLLIWENATSNIMGSPIFGIGLNDWVRPDWMPPSVDSFWLFVALTGGIPAVAGLAAAVAYLLARVHARRGFLETMERWQTRFGWNVAVFSLCVQGLTVHYWGAMHAFFFFVLGLGAWMSDSKEGLVARSTSERSTTTRSR